MKLFSSLLRNRSNSQPSSRSTLQLEALEARDVPSASPMPVLMVIANRDYYHSPLNVTAAPAVQQDTFYGRGILKSTDGGQTWTLHQDIANQLAGALQDSLRPPTPQAPIGGNETLTIGINHTLNDYGQWRQRFGSGL